MNDTNAAAASSSNKTTHFKTKYNLDAANHSEYKYLNFVLF